MSFFLFEFSSGACRIGHVYECGEWLCLSVINTYGHSGGLVARYLISRLVVMYQKDLIV